MRGTDMDSPPNSLYRPALKVAIIIRRRLSIAGRGDRERRSMAKSSKAGSNKRENNARRISGKSWPTNDFEKTWCSPWLRSVLGQKREHAKAARSVACQGGSSQDEHSHSRRANGFRCGIYPADPGSTTRNCIPCRLIVGAISWWPAPNTLIRRSSSSFEISTGMSYIA
jgi:hypothetical protein